MATSSGTIPPPPAMEMKGDLASNWALIIECWQDYVVGNELTELSENTLAARLCSAMGVECRKILKHLPIPETDKNKPPKIIEGLKKHFEPQKNVIYERYLFNSSVQEQGEGIDSYVTKLRRLASTCEYEALEDQLIRDRIVIGIRSKEVRGRLLRDTNLTLKKAVDVCHSDEATTQQLQSIAGSTPNTEEVHYNMKKKKKPWLKNPTQQRQNKLCRYCGNERHNQIEKCPARGTTCTKCGKANHWSKVCESSKPGYTMPNKQKAQKYTKFKQCKQHQQGKRVNQITETEDPISSSEDSIYTVQQVLSSSQTRGKKYYTIVTIGQPSGENTHLKCQLDSGSTTNCMPYKTLQKVMQQDKPKLSPSSSRLTLYNKATIKPLGSVNLKCICNDCSALLHFEIVNEAPCTLLSGESCEVFDLISMNKSQLVHHVSTNNELTMNYIFTEYNDVFKGLGKLPGTCHIETDETVSPIQHAPRHVPIPLKKEIKQKIEQLRKDGIISKVSQPTEWISSLVAVKKPNKLRVCLDPRDLNTAIKRPHFPMPTLEEVIPELNKAKVFTVLDAKDGFLQVVLDEPSSLLTTFWTPFGVATNGIVYLLGYQVLLRNFNVGSWNVWKD